jgi:hypothetical protein
VKYFIFVLALAVLATTTANAETNGTDHTVVDPGSSATPRPTVSSSTTTGGLLGVVGSIAQEGGKDVAFFRTAKQDVKIDVACLSDLMQILVKSEKAKKEINNVQADDRCVISRTDLPYGVRMDCTELPLSVESLDEIANRGTDQIDFLRKIPEGTLTGFTFVTNSLSAQRGVDKDGNPKGEVSEKWPRVLRSSADGKLTLSYVCNPENPAYGKVEVIVFDDATKTLKTKEYDFSKPSGVGEDKRVANNPASCVQCHGTTSVKGTPTLRHIWPEYFFWSDCEKKRGITLYGSSDDNMGPGNFRSRLASSSNKVPDGCNDSKDRAAVEKEKADFAEFKKLQENNPCYNLLPWAKIPAGKENDAEYADYKFYPYADRAQKTDSQGKMNYSVRTNARFTDFYSHLQGQRITQLLKSAPRYEAAKFYVVMEAAECMGPEEEKELKECAGVIVDRTRDSRANFDNLSPQNSAPALFSLAKRIGLSDAEWSMEFKRPGDSSYNAVMFKGTDRGEDGGDHAVSDVVAGEILKDIARTNPFVATASKDGLTRGIEDRFGKGFGCIDDLGGGIRVGLRRNGSEFCRVMKEQAKINLESLKQKGLCRDDSSSTASTTTILDGLDSDSISRGAALVAGKGKCIQCHTPTETNIKDYSQELLFLSHTSATSAQNTRATQLLRAKQAENFWKTLERRLVTDADMPPGENEVLSAQDKADIQAYFKSLIR